MNAAPPDSNAKRRACPAGHYPSWLAVVPDSLAERSDGSIVDSLVAQLELAIIVGDLPAGAKLTEQALAAKLGVSRSPIREALRRLEGRRFVVRTHNVGVRVAGITVEDLGELLDIREALECMAARLAAIHMPDAEISELEHVVLQQQESDTRGGYSPEYQSPPLDFHLCVVRGSHSRNLHDFLYGDGFHILRVVRYRSSLLPDRRREALREHRAIAAAISARQPETAEAAMRAHLRISHANILKNADRLKLIS